MRRYLQETKQPAGNGEKHTLKTSTFRVINNRLPFRCPTCGARRYMVILPHLRRKNVVCHKCATITSCILNRRAKPREPQAGKVLVIIADNKEIEATIHDISPDGAGIDLPQGNPRAMNISVGSRIRFKCTWNPRLFGSNNYEVKSIIGQRIGVKRV